ncbi:MAG: azurin [Myxococcota bacterium]
MRHIVGLVVLLGCGGDVAVELQAGDQMSFNTTRIEAVSGQKVTITLRHTGQMAKTAMGHNVVILKPDTDVPAFAAAASAAGAANNFIPDAQRDAIIAHTSLVGGGETTEVTFTAPEPGTYPYVCTFPGHFVAMRGELVVTAP